MCKVSFVVTFDTVITEYRVILEYRDQQANLLIRVQFRLFEKKIERVQYYSIIYIYTYIIYIFTWFIRLKDNIASLLQKYKSRIDAHTHTLVLQNFPM